MYTKLLFLLFLPFFIAVQGKPTERKVMRKHDNGREHVVLFFEKETGDLVKEEVFFPNGKMQWSGNYKNNVENGSWQFFYENGNLKTMENYLNGKEHGVTTMFNESGKKVKEEFWKHGKLIKESQF